MAATDQPTQRYACTTYSMNGSATQTRLLLENPDESYGESIDDGDSVVFKAGAESSFSYQGEDLSVYEDQFKQLNTTDTQDATFDADWPTGWMRTPLPSTRPPKTCWPTPTTWPGPAKTTTSAAT